MGSNVPPMIPIPHLPPDEPSGHHRSRSRKDRPRLAVRGLRPGAGARTTATTGSPVQPVATPRRAPLHGQSDAVVGLQRRADQRVSAHSVTPSAGNWRKDTEGCLRGGRHGVASATWRRHGRRPSSERGDELRQLALRHSTMSITSP